MGESTWSLWEPEDGRFEYAWMDRVVDAMGKAGIKVILGTPTYSIPAWMAHQHPEILSQPHYQHVWRSPAQTAYGMRQNMDTDSPAFRFYAERLIRHIVAHYKRQPHRHRLAARQRNVELTAPPTRRLQIGFQHYLEKKFVTPEALSKAWFLNYWGEEPAHAGKTCPRATEPSHRLQTRVDPLEPDARH
jgi:beta-galactosidase